MKSPSFFHDCNHEEEEPEGMDGISLFLKRPAKI